MVYIYISLNIFYIPVFYNNIYFLNQGNPSKIFKYYSKNDD